MNFAYIPPMGEVVFVFLATGDFEHVFTRLQLRFIVVSLHTQNQLRYL
jgi:hypothetical protein